MKILTKKPYNISDFKFWEFQEFLGISGVSRNFRNFRIKNGISEILI
jgi:hypothetical protein